MDIRSGRAVHCCLVEPVVGGKVVDGRRNELRSTGCKMELV